jgi:RNA methyltransferase, TrmH family
MCAMISLSESNSAYTPNPLRMPAELTSPRNPLLKDVRRAISRGGLTSEGCCIAETFHLVEEALRSDCSIQAIIASESVRATVERRFGALRNIEVIRIPDSVYAQISATESSQGVMALVKPPVWDLEPLLRGQSLVLVLDGIQDPGNAGAMLRVAEAFGATGVIFIKGSVNPHNPKAVRASAGSVFRVPLVPALDPDLALAAMSQRKIDLYAAMPKAEITLTDADLRRRCAFIIGSEGRGVSSRLQGAALNLRIPTAQVESLNAAVAAGILLYEAWRQRTIEL